MADRSDRPGGGAAEHEVDAPVAGALPRRAPRDRCAVRVATAQALPRGGWRVSTPISIVAVPKPFHGHIATIQRNALGSWTRAPGVAEVILLGDEAGTAEATETGVNGEGPETRR